MGDSAESRTLHTPRLTLRPLTVDDAPAVWPALADPQTMRYMDDLPHADVAATRAYLSRMLSYDGHCYWLVERADDPVPVGYVGYLGATRVPGMGYLMRRDCWGHGYATEACRAALAYGFEQLGFDRVELWINADNGASQRVAHKLGFRLRGQIQQKYPFEADYHTMLVFGLWRHAWRGESPTPAPRLHRAEPVLLVRDVRDSAEYYRDRLGFHIDFLYGDPPVHAGVSRLDWTGQGVVLQLAQDSAERPLTPSGYLYIFVNDVDALHHELHTGGAAVVDPPASQPWGLREFTVRDNNGHLLRFGSHL